MASESETVRCASGLVVPVDRKLVYCRFDESTPGKGDIAVGKFTTSRGCVVYPDDREQDLCPQHIFTDGFLGTCEPEVVYQPEVFLDLVANRF